MNQTWLKKLVNASVIWVIIATPSIAVAQTSPELPSTTTENNATTLQITSVSHNISDQRINVGETLTVTIKGTQGVRASILILGDKQQVKEYKAKETNPGVYTANISLSQRDRVVEGVIMARLQKGTQVIYSAVEQSFAVIQDSNERATSTTEETPPTTTIPPTKEISLPLEITSHYHGQQIINSTLTIRGRTKPYAEVQIKINSSRALVGNLIQLEGDNLIDRIINADNEGRFAITVPKNPDAPQGLQYQISAIAFNQNSQSYPVQLTLIQR